MATTQITLNSQLLDALNTKESRELHETISKLRAYGVGRIVNLPQIIVVGDQCSGKSSVLEALCHVRFPVKDGLCTRFATELVLRPATGTSVKATIRYFDQTKAPLVIEKTGFDEKDLPDIIQESKNHMGISISDKGFSRDVLRLEIEGPEIYPLTVIDLPGLFYMETENQSLSGKDVVDNLVSDYMSKKESIILNVITANQPLATHKALARVKAVDPSGERTIGIITKPDLIVPGSQTEAEYVKLVANDEGANKLALGWHVLRNRADMETEREDRDTVEETFFNTGVWESLPEHCRGISSLRQKLGKVLYDHIRKSLPQVIANIEKNLGEREAELTKLGPSRTKPHEIRPFLTRVASTFESLAKDGIEGRYDHPFFGDLEKEDHKLRAQLRNFNRAFQHILWVKGATRTIRPDNDALQVAESPPEYLQRFLQTYPYDFPDPIVTTEAAVNLELQRQASMNQGKEFPGLSNKDLAIRLFQDQAKPWEGISRFHIERVTFVAKAFVDAIFEHILGSPDTNRTTEAILSNYVDQFFADKERILQEKLAELLKPYHNGYTVALDAEFHAALSKQSMGKMAERVYQILADHQLLGTITLDKTVVTNAISEDKQLDGGEFGTKTAVDMMLAYYESARRTFAVNVINLAVESCLVCDIPNIFTATKVSEMSDERLKELAAETYDVQARRNLLEIDIKVLGNSLALCQKYKPRSVTTLPLAPQEKLGEGDKKKHHTTPARKKTPSRFLKNKSSVLPSGNSPDLKKKTRLFPISDSWELTSKSASNTEEKTSMQAPVASSSDKKPNASYYSVPFWKRVEEWDMIPGCYCLKEPEVSTSITKAFQHICCTEKYRDKSPEEIRLWAYSAELWPATALSSRSRPA